MPRVLESHSRSELESYRRMLVARRSEILSKLGFKFDTLASMGRVAEEDQAQMSHEESISLSLNSLDYEQGRLVEEALDRIRVGDYGACLACGEVIPSKRLNAVPWARYCVGCQDQQRAIQGYPQIETAGSAAEH